MRSTHAARQFVLLSLALGCLATTSTVFGAAPRFTQVLPRGVQRGAEVDLVLTGANLEDAEEVILYDTGLEILGFEIPADANGRRVNLKVRVAADCPIGTQRMRIRTRTGLSDLQNVYVGALPIVEEVEPNTDFSAPQEIVLNSTVHGRVDSEDVDYYAVNCTAGQRLTVEVFGMRLGGPYAGNFFDPYIAILNADRFELAVSDDEPLVWNDGVASMVIPADGRYIVQIRDASYLGDGRAYYLLHIGDFPRPLSAVPAGGRPGETLTVTFYGDAGGTFSRDITLPAEPGERFGLDVTDDRGTSPSRQPFRVNELVNVVEAEPNSSLAEATPAPSVPIAFNGILEQEGDADWFKFTATAGQTFDFECYGRRIRSSIDALVTLHRVSDGGQIAGNDDSRGPDSYFRFQIPEDGEYAVLVRDHLQRGGPSFGYRIEVKPVTPSLVAMPIEFRRYVQPQIEIPQGGGCGLQVNMQRQDFGGPINVFSDDLPPGVSIECPEGWRNEATMPVVFYAAPDAPIGGRCCRIQARLEDPNQPDTQIIGPFKEDILMIRGQNNTSVWYEEQLRMPVVVTAPTPFRVWIEAPTVPLVQGGSMNLKVVCERNEGFTAPIQVLLLQNPPGVNASGSVSIPEGQTEALIPVNAAGNAAVRTSMIAVRAIANIGNGEVETCTPFVPLTVEEQYIRFEFAQAAVEQGAQTQMLVTVTKRKDFEGEAQVTLVGLPANTTAEPLTITKDTTELVFNIAAAPEAPTGNNQNLFCQVLVPENGTTILHNLGTGRLRVDAPLPTAVAATPEPTPMPEPMAEAPPARPLSRLEMLRQQAEARRQAEQAGGSQE